MAFERVSWQRSIPARISARIPALLLGVLLCLIAARPAAALTLLRDADIEYGLTELAFPILRAAGLNPSRVRVLVVDDSAFNAFVVDYQTIYLHSGLILKVDSARVLQAVIAHEAAHIANGHLARRIGNMQSARSAAGLGTILAVAAAAAGAGQAAAGIAAGSQSAAMRSFLSHTRAEEASADRSAARYMTLSGIDPQGLVDLHHAFAGQELLSVANQDPYMRSHPLTRDRIRAAQAYVAAHQGRTGPNPVADYWFARVQGKLSAFARSPKWTRRRVSGERYEDIRLMRQAVAWHRLNDLGRARAAIDAAIALRPDDAYYHDLKGQILMENRDWAGALAAYEKAVELAPGESLILGGLGRAQLAAGRLKPGLASLEKARSRDFRDARVLRDLSIAYARDGQTGMAALVTAERYALAGQLSDAGIHARRAVMQLPRGSPAWQRAQDVLIASEKLDKRKR